MYNNIIALVRQWKVLTDEISSCKLFNKIRVETISIISEEQDHP